MCGTLFLRVNVFMTVPPLCPPQRLIEMSPWGEDASSIEQQIISHNKYHSTIQRSYELEQAREKLVGSRHNWFEYFSKAFALVSLVFELSRSDPIGCVRR